MPHGDLLDLKEPKAQRDRGELQKLAREHAMAVIRDYSAQPRTGVSAEITLCPCNGVHSFFERGQRGGGAGGPGWIMVVMETCLPAGRASGVAVSPCLTSREIKVR